MFGLGSDSAVEVAPQPPHPALTCSPSAARPLAEHRFDHITPHSYCRRLGAQRPAKGGRGANGSVTR